MSKVTYWVGYTYTYEFRDASFEEWETYEDCDACRFACRKKDIPKRVRERIMEELRYETIRNLTINIYEQYPTTDCEL